MSEEELQHPLRCLNEFDDDEVAWVLPGASAACCRAITIVNEYLKGDRDVLLCQDELIEAGLVEYAVL